MIRKTAKTAFEEQVFNYLDSRPLFEIEGQSVTLLLQSVERAPALFHLEIHVVFQLVSSSDSIVLGSEVNRGLRNGPEIRARELANKGCGRETENCSTNGQEEHTSGFVYHFTFGSTKSFAENKSDFAEFIRTQFEPEKVSRERDHYYWDEDLRSLDEERSDRDADRDADPWPTAVADRGSGVGTADDVEPSLLKEALVGTVNRYKRQAAILATSHYLLHFANLSCSLILLGLSVSTRVTLEPDLDRGMRVLCALSIAFTVIVMVYQPAVRADRNRWPVRHFEELAEDCDKICAEPDPGVRRRLLDGIQYKQLKLLETRSP